MLGALKRLKVLLMKPQKAVWLAIAIQAACGRPTQTPIETRTVALAHPEDTASAFEPFAVIDPGQPDRLLVGAQYGVGYNRGGHRIWTWSSQDGGATWSGGRVISKAFPTAGQALAADLTMAVGPDGTVYHLSLTADSAPQGLRTAAAALARSTDGGRTFQPRAVFGTVEAPDPAVMVFTDKSWMVADAGAESPHRGNLYFSWAKNRVDFRDTSVTTHPVVARSRNAGQTVEAPIDLAKTGFGVTLTVDHRGALHAAWYELRPGGTEGFRVLHSISRDGGGSFSEPTVVAELADSSHSIELPQITVGPEGRLLLCWSQGPPLPGAAIDVWCSARAPDSVWTSPQSVLADPAGRTTFAYPAIAATSDAFWLLAYAADSALTVNLYRSEDGTSFQRMVMLASASLPTGFCARPGLPCRRSGEGFFPGDYVSLGSSTRRVVAAYPMPRREGSPGSSTVMVSVVTLPE